MDKITELKQLANLYTDISGRWANQSGVEKFTEVLVDDIVLLLSKSGNIQAAKLVASVYSQQDQQ
jgi:hypothetical protein